MWEWTLNWFKLRDDLFIGTCPVTGPDIDAIHTATGATVLLSLQTDACRRPLGIDWETLRAHSESLQVAMLNTPMLDFDAPDQRRGLPAAVRHLHDLLASSNIVYLHDTSGISRAPLTALGYMTFIEMRPPGEAMGELLAKCPNASPSWEAYQGCRQDLLDMLRERILVRAYYLSQEEPESSPDDHWLRAEREMIRESFVAAPSPLGLRLDPCRDEDARESVM